MISKFSFSKNNKRLDIFYKKLLIKETKSICII